MGWYEVWQTLQFWARPIIDHVFTGQHGGLTRNCQSWLLRYCEWCQWSFVQKEKTIVDKISGCTVRWTIPPWPTALSLCFTKFRCEYSVIRLIDWHLLWCECQGSHHTVGGVKLFGKLKTVTCQTWIYIFRSQQNQHIIMASHSV